MKPKKLYSLVLAVVFVFFGHMRLSAQATPPVDSSEYVNIVKKIQEQGYMGEGTVRINQSSAITQKLDENASVNRANQTLEGYRIRIYRDNSQSARSRSEEIEARFKERYPDVGVYRWYSNPYFFVTVGDFRTVDEAVRFQSRLTSDYGSDYANTYIGTKEKIFFPPISSYER